MAKPILISGIQPTGRLHLGNYLGALKNFVELQDSGKYQCYFFVADLHSLTEEFKPKEKSQQILELTSDYLSAGLDPRKSVIFQQSQIPAHTELGWILSAITPLGELRRMTQFKDKSERQKENANVGLLTYPTLMTADIILYDAEFVPVGEDQLQHLELARALVRKFNQKFGKTFVEPKALMTRIPRLMSLKNPQKKMSKSQPEECLFLDDSTKQISAKIKTAVTDSGSEIKYDLEKKPGISNLLEIYSGLSDKEIPQLEKKFKDKTYSQFKNELTELTSNHFADFRKKKKSLLAKPDHLKKILRGGTEKASQKANKKIAIVKERVGVAI